MPVFKFQAVITREVEETIDISVTSDDQSEATDRAYEVASSWPSSPFTADRALVTKRFYGPISQMTFHDGSNAD